MRGFYFRWKIFLDETARILFIRMLCKSHIFHRAYLLNTENLYCDSEISLKNMLHYVVSYEGQFHYLKIKSMLIKARRLFCRIYMQTIHFSLVWFVEYRDNYYNSLETAYKIGSKCRYLWRQFNHGCIRSEKARSDNSPYRLNDNSGGVSNGRLKETSICDNHFAALSGNDEND